MYRKSLKEWLADANGWRRIWFVATLLTFLYFCLLFPFIQSADGNAYRYSTRRAIESEMKNPICAVYMSKAFSELREPEFDTSGLNGCYNIYLHRKYLKDNKSINENEYQSNFEKEHWERILVYGAMGLIYAIVLSAFVYGVGFVTSWIIKGFKKSESQ
jgi:hypothetical protein